MRCANGFSVTRPSLNRSLTIKHTVSLPLRRHSRTQSQLATSVKRHSVPRTWKSRDSRARAVVAHSMFLITDRIKYYIRGISIFLTISNVSNVCYIIIVKKITETRPKKHFKNEQISRDAAAKKRANTKGAGKINNYCEDIYIPPYNNTY